MSFSLSIFPSVAGFIWIEGMIESTQVLSSDRCNSHQPLLFVIWNPAGFFMLIALVSLDGAHNHKAVTH